VINPVDKVRIAGDKLQTFRALEGGEGIRIPQFTTELDTAKQWIQDGQVVVCRRTLSGHSGAGIVLAKTVDELVAAPLYVVYVRKQKEFRVHVAFGEVIDVQEKRKRQEVAKEDVDFQIRNHQTGWVYCREDIVEPNGLRELALAATKKIGLEFSAVDIIWNEKSNTCYCLELNTAPGLEGTTVERYADAFVRYLRPDSDYESTAPIGRMENWS
jgi:glutathione synthase/RimK-type ligase-like ATP-grasp enzyme